MRLEGLNRSHRASLAKKIVREKHSETGLKEETREEHKIIERGRDSVCVCVRVKDIYKHIRWICYMYILRLGDGFQLPRARPARYHIRSQSHRGSPSQDSDRDWKRGQGEKRNICYTPLPTFPMYPSLTLHNLLYRAQSNKWMHWVCINILDNVKIQPLVCESKAGKITQGLHEGSCVIGLQ